MNSRHVYEKVDDLVRKLEAKGLDDKALEVIEIFSGINELASKAYLGSDITSNSLRSKLYVERIAPYWLLLV